MASRRTSFTVTFIFTAMVLFGIIVLFNAVVGKNTNARIDMTQDKIYTVSPAAKRILSQLQVPVSLTLYITRESEMPSGLKSLERDITDKLEEFKAASGGKLSYTVADPSQNEELAEKLLNKGIRSFQVQSIERDEIGLKMVYSSLEMNYLDKEPEILPQVAPQTLDILEYEICRRVIKLTRDKPPVLAIYSTREALDPQMMQMYMQMGQQPPQPRDLYAQMPQIFQSQGYDARKVDITEQSPIPDDAETLMILAPKNLTERQRYEINRFVQRGGNLFVAVQNYEFDYNPSRMGGFDIAARPQETGIDALLSAYGVRVGSGVFMDRSLETLSIPRTQNIGGLRVQMAEPVQAPIQIRVAGDQFNTESAISDRLGEVLYLWGGRLVPDLVSLEAAGIEYTPLFTSSDEAWEVETTGGPLGPRDFAYDAAAALPRTPFAAMLEGDLPNPYAEGQIPVWGPSDSTTVGAVESFEATESVVVLTACAKMFEDSYLQAGGYNNALFLLNSIDGITMGNDLIQVRAKTLTRRVIKDVSEQTKLFWRGIVTVLVPALVALFGIIRSVRRRREQAAWIGSHAN